ncbi:MAG: hypothetical protein RLZZ157_411 [Pseudomonadota bacterium]
MGLRHCLLGLGALAGAVTQAQAQTQVPPQTVTAPALVPKLAPATAYPDWSLGRADSPLVLIEYASLTCGHCAAFHSDVYPTIKSDYIDKGQVRFILRPLPTGPVPLSLALHALTLCAGKDRHYALIDAFFDQQQEIFRAAQSEGGAKETIFALAERIGGLDEAKASACVNDLDVRGLLKLSADGAAAKGVKSTPTLLINGAPMVLPLGDDLSVAAVRKALDAALAAQRQSARANKRARKAVAR